jgi:hypothetical protein
MFDQQRQGEMRGDQMGVDAEAKQAQAVGKIVLPDRLVPFEQLLAAPDVVDQDVEPPCVAADPLDQGADLVRNEMVRGTAMPAPPSDVTSSAVSSIVSGRWYSDGRSRVDRPVT